MVSPSVSTLAQASNITRLLGINLPPYPLESRPHVEVIAEIVIASVLFTLGVVGNGLVCFVIHKTKFTQSSMYFFMLNLAYADLLVCFVSIPLTVFSTLPAPVFTNFPNIPCKLVRFIQYALPPASVAILTATCVDRYFHICVPFKNIITTSFTKKMAAFCWIFSLLLTIPNFYLIETRKVLYEGQVVEFCAIRETSSDYSFGNGYLVARGLIGFAVPLGVVCFLYYKIVARVWNSKGANINSRNRQRLNVIKSLLTVVVAFTLSWTPFSVTNKILLFDKNREMITGAEIITFWVGLSASVYNPWIYAFYNKNFRQAFLKVVFRKKMRKEAKAKAIQRSFRPPAQTLPDLFCHAEFQIPRRRIFSYTGESVNDRRMTEQRGFVRRLQSIKEESVLTQFEKEDVSWKNAKNREEKEKVLSPRRELHLELRFQEFDVTTVEFFAVNKPHTKFKPDQGRKFTRKQRLESDEDDVFECPENAESFVQNNSPSSKYSVSGRKYIANASRGRSPRRHSYNGSPSRDVLSHSYNMQLTSYCAEKDQSRAKTRKLKVDRSISANIDSMSRPVKF